MSRLRAVVLSVPLLVLGTLLGHDLTYRLVYPDAAARALADRVAGHSYLDQQRFATTVCVALIVVAVALIAVEIPRRNARGALPAWLFASLPLVGYGGQECLERAVGGPGIALGDLTSRTFVVGLVVQLPVAAVMYLVARILFRIAVAVSRVLGHAAVLRTWRTDVGSVPWSTCWLEPRVATLELRLGGRAPPEPLDRR